MVDTDIKDLAELDDGKINLTINGQTQEGLNTEGEDIPELREDNIDYTRFDNLTDMFAEGVEQFAYFISRGIPDEFQKKTKEETDLHSSRNGVKAMKVCIDLLSTELKTGKTGYVAPEEYKYLHEWYVDGIINFMGITMARVPEQLDNPDDENHQVKCAIDALKQVRKKLLAYIREQTVVK